MCQQQYPLPFVPTSEMWTEVTMSPFTEVDHEELGNGVRKTSWNYTDLGSMEKARDFSFLTGFGLPTSEND